MNPSSKSAPPARPEADARRQAAPARPIETPPVDPLLLEVADVVNTTLDLDTLLHRVAELVRKVIDYDIFAILLLHEKAQELRVRFALGHPPDVEKMHIKVGEGITGQAALRREPVLAGDVTAEPRYIGCMPGVRSELAIPLIVKNKVIGVLDIESPKPGYFTEDHKNLLALIASRVAIGIENARLYTRVSRQAKTLQLIYDISRELTSILDLDQLLKRVGELLNRLIDFQMFSVLLLDAGGTKLVHRFSIRFAETVHLKHDIPLDRGLVGYAARHKEAVLAPDVSKDPRYIELNPETRSELCVPLIYQDRVIGVLDLEHTKRGYFHEDHVRTISALAAQVAIAIENARLYEQVVRQEQRLERELALARELQLRLLPPCCPVLQNAQLAARFQPAHQIGGDMYDFLEYSGKCVSVAIGDVSGKGAAAALYAALVSGILRANAGMEPGPADMLSMINLSLQERAVDAQFISMIYALWDDDARLMRIANSGLPRPIHCRDGRTEVIECAGLPLGLFTDAEYDEVTIRPAPGDVFVFFSDGIVDAMNRDGVLFSRQQVEEIVAASCQRSPDDIVSAIFAAVAEHSTGMETFDDQTVVAIKISGKPEVAKGTRARKK